MPQPFSLAALEQLSPKEEEELLILLEAQEAEEDINVLAEFVLKNEGGRPITQGAIHRAFHAHIDWCHDRGLRAGLVAPWGHGKTEQVVILRTLRTLGRNPNARLKLICNTDDNASIRIAAIERYIEDSTELRIVYPHLRPNRRAVWNTERLTVARSSPSKDPSVDGFGILSTRGLGGRADELLFDDVCDLKDIIEPSIRQKKDDAMHKTWMSRLVPNGRVTYIATAWHEKDLTHRLRLNPNWSFLWMGVSDDLRRIDCQLYNADRTHPLLARRLDAAGDAGGAAAG